jgi:hypothetical protein
MEKRECELFALVKQTGNGLIEKQENMLTYLYIKEIHDTK